MGENKEKLNPDERERNLGPRGLGWDHNNTLDSFLRDEEINEEESGHVAPGWNLKAPVPPRKSSAGVRRARKRRRTLKGVFSAVLILAILAGIVVAGGIFYDKRTQFAYAEKLYQNRRFEDAVKAYAELEKYEFLLGEEEKKEMTRRKAVSYVFAGNYGVALRYLDSLGDYKDANKNLREIVQAFSGTIATGYLHTVALRRNGQVLAAGNNDFGQCDLGGWNEMVAVAAASSHTLGLRRDGTVLAAGNNDFGQCNVSEWNRVKAIATGEDHSAALRNDGIVLAAGSNDFGQCAVENWTEIEEIAVGKSHTVGLRKDGSVVAVGDNSMGQCDVGNWQNIVFVAANNNTTIGVQKDGWVVAAGDNGIGQCVVKDMEDVMAAAVGTGHTLGLKTNGRVVTAGANDKRQCMVSLWKNVVAVSAGKYHSVGLNNDGTLYVTGNNQMGQCNVEDWNEIGIPEGIVQIAVD